MSVRPILLQKDGAIKGIPGAYRTSPPPVAGPYAGSDALEDVTYYTVNSFGEVELKTVKAYSFYIDSVSGGTDTSGDGTLANPWRSFNFARTILYNINQCMIQRYCCTYIVLKMKGIIDYPLNGWQLFSGQRFIIEPWDSDFINIALEYDSNGSVMVSFGYMILKNIKIEVTSNTGQGYGIGYFYNSILNNVEVNANIYSRQSSPAYFGGAYSGSNSIIYNSSVNIVIDASYYSQNIFGFGYCNNSIFYECNSTITSEGGYLLGFRDNYNSAFYSCNGYVYGVLGCGFRDNINSVFLNCAGNSIGSITCDI